MATIPEIIDGIVDAIIPGPDLLNHETQEQFETHKKMVEEEAKEDPENG